MKDSGKRTKLRGNASYPGRRRAGLAVLLMVLTLLGLFAVFVQPQTAALIKKWIGGAVPGGGSPLNGESAPTQNMSLHYLDVEKCNCVLVESGDGHFMLIDAGSNDQEHTDKIMDYLNREGVKTLDYVLLTHPHRDHISAVPQIVNRFDVNEILMGEFDVDVIGTKTYQRVMSALEGKDILMTNPGPGEKYALGNASFTILINDDSVETALEEPNDCSIGLMLTDGLHRFLFYGDGEKRAEEALQNSGFDLNADVLMVAHHGSNSSTKKAILKKVNPSIAVIPCGIDGDGEVQKPSDKVLKRLEEAGVMVYRSDMDGNVVIESKPDGLFVTTERQRD